MKLPEAFSLQMQHILGEEYRAFVESLAEPTPVTIRLNNRKKTSEPVITNGNVLWHRNAHYLAERPVFTLDPAFHAGAYYVQEASSMFVAEAIRQTVDTSKSLRVMDLCAAPGGKSTLLASLLNNNSLLVANEVIKSRIGVLKENLEKWGFPNYIVSNHDPEEMIDLEGFFDVVLTDAPCSGEGLFRKDPDAMNEWSENSVQLCSARQKRILQAAAMLVAPGGILCYSTCTYNEKENELNAQWLTQVADFEHIKLQIPADWGIVEKKYGYQFFPHKVRGEGFYISVFRKTRGEKQEARGKIKLNRLPQKKIDVLKEWLEIPNAFEYYEKPDGQIVAIPANLSNEYSVIFRALHKRSSGLEIGQFKGTDFIPSHDLALSTVIAKDLPAVELSKEDALKFLKKENLGVDLSHQPKGWLLAHYQGLNLGFMKLIGDRINNYLPKEWRIRMEIPE
ncbi:methyltransferase RsmF C-terminal domain-like protein [Emticicia sp. BO119]|uniref:methyltransferase RsmF C-terminal domain-like protein n=1 Tax=Emticicia sp. BO119 TaxID=2757768 RepID=UPI0015F05598|nr:methyltransferase domain-containing protein [Emticicia sp. BO119]MBA4851920.1 methyltransferase domain-containing protein [Emticicia sp. BO119]